MLITAHSGCDGTPMNSAQFIRHAMQLPAGTIQALEIDIRRDAYGKLILTHDAPTGAAPYTLAEAFAALADCDLAINCDLKEPGLERPVLQAAEQAGIQPERIIFSGTVAPYPRGCWPAFMAGTQVYLNIEELIPGLYAPLEQGRPVDEAAVLRGIALAAETGCAALNVNFQLCVPAFVAACKKAGVVLSVWTVTEEEDIRRIVPLAPLNITSRAPALVHQIATMAV